MAKQTIVIEKDAEVEVHYAAACVFVLFTATAEMPSYNGLPDGSIIKVNCTADFNRLCSDYPGCFCLTEETEE